MPIDPSTGGWIPEAGDMNTITAGGYQGTPADSQFYGSWLQGIYPQQPAASSYDAYQRAGDYMTAFQNGPLSMSRYGAAGMTGGLLTESDFFKIYNQPGYRGEWGQQYGTIPGRTGGIGDAQWDDRHDNFIDYAQSHGYGTGQPWGANYGFIEQEMMGPERYSWGLLQNANDITAGVKGGLRYERPGISHEDWRLANAQATYGNTASPMPWLSGAQSGWGSYPTGNASPYVGGGGYGNWDQFGLGASGGGWQSADFGGDAFTNAQYARGGSNTGIGYRWQPDGTYGPGPSPTDFSGVSTYNDGTPFGPGGYGGYGNNEYGYGGGDYLSQFSQTPTAWNTLQFTVGAPRSGGAPSASTLNGFGTYGGGYGGNEYGYGGGYGGGSVLGQTDSAIGEAQGWGAANQAWQEVIDRNAAYTAQNQATLNALPSSPQNYESLVQSYDRNFGGYNAPTYSWL